MAKEGQVLNPKEKNCTTEQLSSGWFPGEMVSSYEVNPSQSPGAAMGRTFLHARLRAAENAALRAGHGAPAEPELARSRSFKAPLASSRERTG